MFIRRAAIEIEDIYVQDQTSKKWAWKEIVKRSTALKRSADFLPMEAFEYDPENFVYFRARSITANIPNGNGDMFETKELAASYPTFVGKGFYIEHQSDSIEKAKGIILDSVWHPDQNYVECLIAVDRKAYPEIARQIETGILGSVSMGCTVEEAECSVCHNIARTAKDLCCHMNPMSGAYCKGKTMSDGKKAFEINRKVTFTELSGVAQPADFEAHVFEVFASMHRNLLKHASAYRESKAKANGCPDGKCTLDLAIARLSSEEKMYLKAAIDKQALTEQSPSTFQGNPQVDSGAANPKSDIDPKMTDYSGPERRRRPLKTRLDPAHAEHTCACGGTGGCSHHASLEKKAQDEKHCPECDTPNQFGELCARCRRDEEERAEEGRQGSKKLTGETMNDAMTPMDVKINNEIYKAVNEKIDAEVKGEVRDQVDKLLGDLVQEIKSPIEDAVSQQVEESRDDVQKTVDQVAQEVAAPAPSSSPSPSIQYSPYATAAMEVDRAISRTALGEGEKKALQSRLMDIMKRSIGSITVGPNHQLVLEAKGFRLYAQGKPTEMVIDITNPEDRSPETISKLREACLIDTKAD